MVARWQSIEHASKGKMPLRRKAGNFRAPSKIQLLVGLIFVLCFILFQFDLNSSAQDHGTPRNRGSRDETFMEVVKEVVAPKNICNDCVPDNSCPLIAIALATTSRTMAERIENPGKQKLAMNRVNHLRRPEGKLRSVKRSNDRSTQNSSDTRILTSSSLFRIMLPSIVETADCGFRYIVVVGYDLGDRYYDNSVSRSQVAAWFDGNIAGPLSDRNIPVQLAMVACNNTLRKPGPVFTTATQEAYRLGADFIYRVNDDSEFVTPWAKKLSESVMSMGVPFGVAGPLVCNQGGNIRILTHDFTHRTHMEIFSNWYYPHELADWWMDSWISRVYGSKRTSLMQEVLVGHRTKEHGRRYGIDHKNKDALEPLVEVGKSQIIAYMRKLNVPLENISTFLSDKFDGRGADLRASNITSFQGHKFDWAKRKGC